MDMLCIHTDRCIWKIGYIPAIMCISIHIHINEHNDLKHKNLEALNGNMELCYMKFGTLGFVQQKLYTLHQNSNVLRICLINQ